MKLVVELMKTRFVTLHPEQKLTQAIAIMSLYHLSVIPLIDRDEKLCGLLSKHDILQLLKDAFSVEGEEIRFHPDSLLDYELKSIAGLMEFPICSISADAPIVEAVRQVLLYGYPCLPVIDDAGKLIGLFDPLDVVAAVMDGRFLPA